MSLNELPNDLYAILLASGLSSRFHGDKLLEEIGGRAIARISAENIRSAGIGNMVIVANPEVKKLLGNEGYRHIVLNENPEEGIGYAIRLGVSHVTESAHIVIFPSDMPLFGAAMIQKLIGFFYEDTSAIACCNLNGIRMSPTVFPKSCRKDLLTLKSDKGGISIINSGKYQVRDLIIGDSNIMQDVDTTDDLELARRISAMYLSK